MEEDIKLLPGLLDMNILFDNANINQQHSILNEVFKQGLTFRDGAFRTPSVNPTFSHNILKMKEKGLLLVEQPLDLSDGLPLCGERGIRTPGGLTLNGFQDRRIRPLCHLSTTKVIQRSQIRNVIV